MKVFMLLLSLSYSLLAFDYPTKAGSHRNLPCIDSKYTFKIYLPKNYAVKTDKQFPALFIQMPGGSPGFMEFESWADKKDFIIVTIDGYSNKTFDDQEKAQTAVLKSLSSFRIHHCLRFATGVSGGGWASVLLNKRNPDTFAGALILVHCGNGDYVHKHQSAVMLLGGKDDIHDHKHCLNDPVKFYIKNGYHTKHKVFPTMGHQAAPIKERTAMLEYMYNYQSITHPSLSKQEIKEGWDAIMPNFHSVIGENATNDTKLAFVSNYLDAYTATSSAYDKDFLRICSSHFYDSTQGGRQ